MDHTPIELDDECLFRYEMLPEHLYVHISGPRNSFRAMRAYVSQIAEISKFTPTKRILVETHFPPAASVHDIFEIINELHEFGLSKKIFAVVDGDVQHDEANKFAEMVAANRKLKIRIFDTRTDAESWLSNQID
jgi:hypothetical protein